MKYITPLFTPFLEQYHRWILWCPVFMACGIGFYFSLLFEPSMAVSSTVVLFFACLLIVFQDSFWPRIACLVLLLAALGFMASVFRTQVAGTPMLEGDTGPLMIEGRVLEVEKEPSGAKILLGDVQLEDMDAAITPKKVRLKLADKYGIPSPGAFIRVLGVLMPPSPPVSPRSYDFQRHMFFQGIGGTGYTVRPYDVMAHAPAHMMTAENLREEAKARILHTKGNPESKAVLIALLVDERKLIPEKTWEDIRISGLAHLVAISGLHISLVAGFVFFFVRALLAAIPYIAIHYPVKKISAIIAFVSIFFYCWLAGSPVSAERSVIMTGIVLFAVMIDRVAISLRLAAIAAMVVLLLTPEMLFSAGFQMSFAAVSALIAFYESWRFKYVPRLLGRGIIYKGAAYFAATLLTTVIASLATAPFSMFHFQRSALLPGVLANMAAVPLTSLWVMPMGFTGLLLMPFGIEGIFIRSAIEGMDVILQIAREAAAMPGSAWHGNAWSQMALVVMVLGGLWVIIWQGRLRLIGFPIICLGIFMAVQTVQPDILVGPDGKMTGILNERDGRLYVSTKRAERFARQVWESEYGGIESYSWPYKKQSDDFAMRCDPMGCLYHAKGLSFAFPAHPVAAYEDCRLADVVIAPQFYNLPAICKKKNVMTRRDLKENGAHAYYLNEKTYKLETVRGVRGLRPWTVY